jgi:carbon monoxide dehydrogenase subunit G
MDLEFRHHFDATPEALWLVLLDPDRVGACVPGMQSVSVISDTEYRARIRVKIAFISAHFDIRTVITKTDPPHLLRAEASGEDGKIGSSVSAKVEMRLTPTGDNQTELCVKARADVLGRLGTLGLNPMRTKAEGMWGQFCEALALQLQLSGGFPAAEAAASPTSTIAPASRAPVMASPVPAATKRRSGWLSWFAPRSEVFRAEIERNGSRVVLTCPPDQAELCLAWLDRNLRGERS